MRLACGRWWRKSGRLCWAAMVTCDEAGRDGFWLHRFLVAQGAQSQVVDPGSVLVNRRGRRAKSDRLDVEGLLRVVIRHDAGDRHLGRMVVVPSVAQEDARRPTRERQRLLSERTAHSNRIKGLLATQGIYGYQPLRADRRVRLAALRRADGEPPAPALQVELERLEVIDAQVAALEKARRTALAGAGADDREAQAMRLLMRLKSIAIEFASVLTREVFYRDFANRRAVGSFVGLAPSPFKSGAVDHEQGIGKAGNRRARSTMIELAWQWVRLQPHSDLTLWFKARLGDGRSGRRKRQLLVALWRYVTTGVIPAGAQLKG